ncbi:hypothetical protein GGQ84_003101 [Desulfitispora alkaliphila]|uniref:hypothetical protein n=1 Tax=Desulfitispora alkaliphila TaxID=622674 RepID=UPI003D1B7C5A
MKLENALNLLLTSIALQEKSLSEMMDAETKKMLYVLDECKLEKLSIQDTKDIHKSVNQTLTNMIKMQMLLQSKVENIVELVPTTTANSASTTNSKTTSTTSTSTTTSTTSTSTTTTKKKLVWRIP